MNRAIGISIQSLRTNKRNTAVIVLVMLLSMAFLMTVCAVWVALIDAQFNQISAWYSEHAPVENLSAQVHSDPDFQGVLLAGMLFIGIAAWIAGISVRNVLALNDGARTRTLAVLTSMGAKRHHCLIFLVSDALLPALVSMPAGFLLGMGISERLIQYLNQAVFARIGLPEIPLLQGKPLLYIGAMAMLGWCTVLSASLRPSLRLMRIPLVELAKTKDDISAVLRETRFDRLIIRCFGICGKLASANYENCKRRYRMFTRTVSVSASFLILILLLIAYLRSMESTADRITTENFFNFFLYSALAATLLSLIGVCSILYVQFQKRKSEFALLRSTGIRQTQLCGMISVEMLYYTFRFLFQLILTTFAEDLLLYIFLGRDDLAFAFPWKSICAVGCGVLLILLTVSLWMMRTATRICIIDELKKTD